MKNFIEISDSEEEQVDKLKKWWDSNGKQIIAGAVLGLAGIFGWNYYVDYQDSQALNARALYLSYASDSANVGAYDKLIKDHPSSSYADQGHSIMAKYLFDAGNYSLALDAIKAFNESRGFCHCFNCSSSNSFTLFRAWSASRGTSCSEYGKC